MDIERMIYERDHPSLVDAQFREEVLRATAAARGVEQPVGLGGVALGLDTESAAAEAVVGPPEAPVDVLLAFASESVWQALSAEQQEKATEIRSKMAKHLEPLGVTETDLRLLQVEAKNGTKELRLVHTGAGIDIGDRTRDHDPARSYEAVMSADNDSKFIFDLDGITYDTRTGMNSAAYIAKVQDARDRNVILPDSPELYKKTGFALRTQTMLTGEQRTPAGGVRIRDVYEDSGRSVGARIHMPDEDRRGFCVCPAVLINL